MPTVQQTSTFNVFGTIYKSLEAAVAAFSLPAWLPDRPVVVANWNDATLSLPSFSAIDIPVSMPNDFQGMQVGNNQRGMKSLNIFEVSCWVGQINVDANTPNTAWQAQLRTMTDWVLTWAGEANVLVIQDYAANNDNPSATAYKINLGDITPLVHQVDSQNPAVIRKRILIDYDYVYRVT